MDFSVSQVMKHDAILSFLLYRFFSFPSPPFIMWRESSLPSHLHLFFFYDPFSLSLTVPLSLRSHLQLISHLFGKTLSRLTRWICLAVAGCFQPHVKIRIAGLFFVDWMGNKWTWSHDLEFLFFICHWNQQLFPSPTDAALLNMTTQPEESEMTWLSKAIEVSRKVPRRYQAHYFYIQMKKILSELFVRRTRGTTFYPFPFFSFNARLSSCLESIGSRPQYGDSFGAQCVPDSLEKNAIREDEWETNNVKKWIQ